LRSSISVEIEANKRKMVDLPEKNENYTMVGKKKVILGEKLLGIVPNRTPNVQFSEQTAYFVIPDEVCPNEENGEDFRMEYSIKCVGNLFDYQVKGPTLEHNVLISSPVPSIERLSKIDYNDETKHDITVERYFEKISSVEGVISGFNL
jgi:hypothetical protein